MCIRDSPNSQSQRKFLLLVTVEKCTRGYTPPTKTVWWEFPTPNTSWPSTWWRHQLSSIHYCRRHCDIQSDQGSCMVQCDSCDFCYEESPPWQDCKEANFTKIRSYLLSGWWCIHNDSFKGQPAKLSDGTHHMGMAHVARVSIVLLYISLGYVHITCFLLLYVFMYINSPHTS